MDLFCVDAREGQPDIAKFGCAWATESDQGYCDSWHAWRAIAQTYAQRGYTMVAHGAQQAVALLLYNHQEHVRVFYRGEDYTHAEWYFNDTDPAMQIWDSRPLSGNMTLRELIRSAKMQPYDTPQRYTWQYREAWLKQCFAHRRPGCPLCWGMIDHANWFCEAHNVPECDECWKLQIVRAIHSYMSSYCAFMELYQLQPSRTIGSAAHKVWRKLDNPDPIRLPSRDMDDFARRAYVGGRVEVFKQGWCGPVTYADGNMWYASILRDIELPRPETMLTLSDGDWDMDSFQYSGVSECTVTVPDMYVPPLPYRWGELLTFPAGTFRAVFTHHELQLALSRGVTVRQVHRCLWGKDTYKPFANFGAGMIALRLQYQREHNARETAVKQMANALYGMIGMKPYHDTQSVMPLPKECTLADFPYHDAKVTQSHVLLRRSNHSYRRGKYANPLWAALITAAARIKLYYHLEAQGANLVYCDTDGVICMGECIGTGTGPGALGVKGFYEVSTILGPKTYRLTSSRGTQRIAHAGIPQWQFDRLISSGEAFNYRPASVLEGFETPLEPGVWYRLPVTKRHGLGKRQLCRTDAVVLSGDWTDTRPLVMSELYENPMERII